MVSGTATTTGFYDVIRWYGLTLATDEEEEDDDDDGIFMVDIRALDQM
jgi:hypothetical protein